MHLEISIAFPGSIIDLEPSLLKQTLKLGFIGRIAAIYGVREILVYKDFSSSNNSLRIARSILEYILTPPYLRRILFPKSKILRYVGLIPPLQIQTHIVEAEPKIGECRKGAIIKDTGKYVWIYVGASQLVRAKREKKKYCKNKLCFAKIISINKDVIEGVIVRDPVKDCNYSYVGFDVKTYNSLYKLLLEYKKKKYLIIATSRRGVYIENIVSSIKKKIQQQRNLLILFGGPREGLYEIASHENIDLENYVDFVVNLVKNQYTRTIRTEEAIAIAMALLGFIVY